MKSLYRATLILSILLNSSNFKSLAQTATSLMNSGSPAKKEARFISAYNPWIGSQVGYMFGDSKEFSDNLITSAKIMYQIDLGKERLQLPVVGNISNIVKDKSSFADEEEKIESMIKDLVTSNQGINVGIQPYYIIADPADTDDKYYFLAHGVASWKLNGFKSDQGNMSYLNQLRYGAGVEIGLGKTENKKSRLTASLTPVFNQVLDKETLKTLMPDQKALITTLELTVVIPIAYGVGVMIENTFPLSSGKNVFRAGIVFSAETVR